MLRCSETYSLRLSVEEPSGTALFDVVVNETVGHNANFNSVAACRNANSDEVLDELLSQLATGLSRAKAP